MSIRFFPVYPFDTRIFDPSLDGNALSNALGPQPHLELIHSVQWLIGKPDLSSTVFGDNWPMAFRNSKTEKLLLHLPLIPPYLGPGLANTILNKSKLHIYFHNPNIVIEGKDAGIWQYVLAPPLHCAEIKLPLPRCLQRLALAAKGSKIASPKRLSGAREAFEEASEGLKTAKEAVKSVKGMVSRGLDPDKHFDTLGAWAEAADKESQARENLRKIERGDDYTQYEALKEESRQIDKIKDNENQWKEVEDDARKSQQYHEREERGHKKQQGDWERVEKKQGDLEKGHNKQATLHEEEAQKKRKKQAEEQGQADFHHHSRDNLEIQQDYHDKAAKKAQKQSKEAKERADEAEKRRYGHELDGMTAESIGEYEKERGQDAVAAEEDKKAQVAREQERQAREERDRELDQKRRADEKAQAHEEQREIAQKEAQHHDEQAQEYQKKADEQGKQAREEEGEARKSRQKAETAKSNKDQAKQKKDEAKAKAKESRKKADRAKGEADAAREERLRKKKARKRAGRALSRKLSPPASIMLPSLLCFLPIGHSVYYYMSLWDLAKVWLKVLAIMLADVVDAYLGFITDSLATVVGGDVAKWVGETANGMLKGVTSHTLRSWGSDDKLSIHVPVKVGCLEYQYEWSEDLDSGEQSWTHTGTIEHGDHKLSASKTETEAEDGTHSEELEITGSSKIDVLSAEGTYKESTTTGPDGRINYKRSTEVKPKVGPFPTEAYHSEDEITIL